LILDEFIPKDPSQGKLIYQGPLKETELPEPDIIKAAIWRIKLSGAPGIDGMTANMIRKAWPALKDPADNSPTVVNRRSSFSYPNQAY